MAPFFLRVDASFNTSPNFKLGFSEPTFFTKRIQGESLRLFLRVLFAGLRFRVAII